MAVETYYSSVNDAINDVFFDGRHAGQPVYLSLDAEARDELASKLGVEGSTVEEDVCRSVSRTLIKFGDPYDRFVRDARTWRRQGGNTPPPFSALLFTFAHAATLMAADGNFAGSNYYHRLSQVTGLSREVLSTHRASMELLWTSLNNWLVEKSHMLGRPTARSMGATWRYVGWSISQAIVRASDRELFHGMFEHFGFSGNEALSTRDMERYLATWMLTSGPNTRLRNAWQKPALQERVAEAALAELASWNAKLVGQGMDGGQLRPMRLSLLASIIPKFPKNTLELHLGQPGEAVDQGSLFGNGDAYRLANDLFGDFATISPPPLGPRNAYLGQPHAFQRQDGDRGLEWRPRLVMPLSRRGALWVEVPRVSFGVPHALLVRDMQSLPRDVETYLMQAAVKPPTIATPSTLTGLPAGWVLYTDVQIGRSDVHPSKDDLDCLVPVGEQGVLEISGGLQLWKEFYHAQSTPTVTLLAPPGPAKIELFSLPEEETVLTEASADGIEVSMAVDANAFPSSLGIMAKGYRASTLVDSRELFFRDANNPVPLNREGKGILGYASVTTASLLQGLNGPRVVGLTLEGQFPARQEAGTTLDASALPQGDTEKIQEVVLADALAAHVANQACIERGYHVWRFPMVPKDTPRGTPFHGRCLDCSQELVIMYRSSGKPRLAATPARIPLAPMVVAAKPSTATKVQHDLLVDALGFVGHGSWGRFENFLQLDEAIPYLGRETAQDLFLLGFLDLEVRPGSNAIKSWCVAPATIAYTGERSAFLTGFRSTALMGAMREAVEVAGGKFVEQFFSTRASSIRIEGLLHGEATSALAGVCDPHGRAVSVVENAGVAIARACLSLGGIEAALVPASIGKARNLQRFDPRSAKWSNVHSAGAIGGYRWNDGFQSYAFVGEGGATLAGPYQIIKLLAARAGGTRLHNYDRATRTFSCTLGCEPPGLLARSLVACSGNLPQVSKGILSYGDVPPDVASYVFAALYDKSI